MFKKWMYALTLTVLTTAFAAGAVLAGESQPGKGRQRVYGEVTAVATDGFTLVDPAGESLSFTTGPETVFRSKEGELSGLEALEPGMKVFVVAESAESGNAIARVGVALPDDFDPSQWRQLRGEVAAVDVVAGTFSLLKNDGETLSLLVDEGTRFAGGLSGLEGLEVGTVVGVAAHVGEDGQLTARLVALSPAAKQTRPRRGTVAAVNPAAGTFTLLTPQGEEITFAVDESTRYKSKDGSVAGLTDLQVDMVAVVMAQSQGNGLALATVVAAGDAEDLPEFDVRARGEVTDVAEASLTIATADGETLTFRVDTQTRFFSSGGAVQSLDGLSIGATVIVGAVETEDGGLLAKVIAARAVSP